MSWLKTRIPPPVWLLASGFLIWLVARQLPGQNLHFEGQMLLSVLLGAAGIAVELTSVGAFLKRKTTVNPLSPNKAKVFINQGLYRYSRNPMYLGMSLLLLAWIMFLGAILGLIFLAGFMFVLTELQIKPEEEALEAKFGEAYRTYRKKVRRWI
ncbi:isoprenylcysteine carboxylmethyltransferase family protein [Roseibium polysiphoniae]|uniref:Isoprenylcysteine carboxylmethyltransferase family protein n=1 Tax=Roseibium polysiphoniae TaxID=2571221 RepID=A0A944CFM7_9HYPH|nr:isoprenylcysteine carboxylmethyltransferase family protein [Roseibium polysiphoniae]MBS8262154.1 isoprenylcysteine carboxylmethyltransferase family protein [Roseibium polysiphoniae]